MDHPVIDTPFERAEDPPPGTRVVDIDGVPAFLRREADAIELFVPAPDDIFGGTRFRAGVLGPGEAAIWQQVEDLLASVHYEPPLQPTDRLGEEAAAAAARAVVEHKASQDGAYACFPRTPGRSRHAVVRRLPGYSRLHRKLPVTCSTEIEGTPLEVWKMTLTSSWARDRAGQRVRWPRPCGSVRTATTRRRAVAVTRPTGPDRPPDASSLSDIRTTSRTSVRPCA